MSKSQYYKSTEETTLIKSISSFKQDLSNKTIKQLIKNGHITINKKIITINTYPVKVNDLIEITYDKPKDNPFNLDIIYEDDYLIAINKPYGLLSISNDKEKELTAYRMVSDYVKKNNHKYIFVLHRLDQDTSGILMFSKDEQIRDKMQDNWNTIVKKRGYLAIVDGKLTGSKTIKSYLLENKQQFVYSSKNNEGKLAITHYQSLKTNKAYSLLQVFIDTGRRNQIRVHLSELGYPIVGDKKYKCQTNPLKRLCLHANILEFIHPITKKLVHLETAIPNEFKNLTK